MAIAAPNALSAQDFAALRQWIAQLNPDEPITRAVIDRAFDPAPNTPAPANGRPSLRSLPEWHPVRQICERILGRETRGEFIEEVWRRFNELDPYRQQYGAAAVTRTAGSPYGGAFMNTSGGALAFDPRSAERLQRFNIVAANVQQGRYDMRELEDLATLFCGVDHERHAQLCFWMGYKRFNDDDFVGAGKVLDEVRYATSVYELAKCWSVRTAAKLSHGVDRDPRSTVDAIARCDEFLRAFPQSTYTADVQQIRAQMVDVRATSDRHVIEHYARDRSNDPFLSYADRQSAANAVNYRVQQYQSDPRYPDAETNPTVLFNSAVAYHQSHRDAEANAVYTRLRDLYPTWKGTEQLAEYLGPALGQTGRRANTDDARELYDLIVQARNNGQRAYGEALYHQLATTNPNSEYIPRAAYALGLNPMASAPAPSWGTAAPTAARGTVPTSAPPTATEIYNVVASRRNAGRIVEAKSFYRLLASRYPGSPEALRAAAELGLGAMAMGPSAQRVAGFAAPISLSAMSKEQLDEKAVPGAPQAMAAYAELYNRFRDWPGTLKAAQRLGLVAG